MQVARSCGFLIYRSQPEHSVLLMKHVDRWDIPKGHIDPGETDEEAALRELVEETGITESDINIDTNFLFQHRYEVNLKRYGDKPVMKTLIVYLAELVRDVDIVVTEHESYEWHPWSPPHKIQKKTIDGLLEHLAKHWERRPPHDA
jgi:8-oxo-dGTP pyrophosphatase MutT (NUDIX family)